MNEIEKKRLRNFYLFLSLFFWCGWVTGIIFLGIFAKGYWWIALVTGIVIHLYSTASREHAKRTDNSKED